MKISLEKLRKEMDKQDDVREKVIRESRKIIQKSKTAIGAVHRDALGEALPVLHDMKEDLARVKETITHSPRLEFEGIFKVAVQEYVEALALYEFTKNGSLLAYSEEFLDPE